MTYSPTLTRTAAALVAALLVGCGREPAAGPPTIHLGRDECAGCGMLVNESRCSCALLIVRDGRREHAVFDDIGCLLDYRADHPETVVVESFVHDYLEETWVSASAARYLVGVGGAIATPMGSGLVAFGTQAAASAQRELSGGEIADAARAAEARRAWRSALRAGAPATP